MQSRLHDFNTAAARALAFFFGGFGLLNLLGNFRLPRFNANLWWIDLRVLPEIPATLFLLTASICLIGFAIWPPRSLWRRGLTTVSVGLLAVAALWNALEFYTLLAQGRLHSRLPIPLRPQCLPPRPRRARCARSCPFPIS